MNKFQKVFSITLTTQAWSKLSVTIIFSVLHLLLLYHSTDRNMGPSLSRSITKSDYPFLLQYFQFQEHRTTNRHRRDLQEVQQILHPIPCPASSNLLLKASPHFLRLPGYALKQHLTVTGHIPGTKGRGQHWEEGWDYLNSQRGSWKQINDLLKPHTDSCWAWA